MGDVRASMQPVSEWLQVSLSLGTALEGLTEDDLNLRGGPNGWSIRENVHHLVECHLAACTMVIAAVGMSGYRYDCSWMTSNRAQMVRMGYNRGAVGPAVEVLPVLCRYVAALLNATPDALFCEVKFLGAPGTEPYAMTVQQMISQEAKHGQLHLQEIDETLKQRRR